MKDSLLIQRRRGELLFRFITLGVLIFIIRLFYLQVIQYKHFYNKAQSNIHRPSYTPGPRGKIRDRNGKILADYFHAYEIRLVPYKIERNPDILSKLLKMTSRIKLEDIANCLSKAKDPQKSVALYTFIDTFSVKRNNREREREISFLHRIWQSQNELPGVEIKKLPHDHIDILNQ